MKRLIILEIILMSFIWSPIVTANIYTWTDENNVRHFTNQSAPPGAEIFLRDSDPEPASLTETPDEIEKNDLITEKQDLEDRLNESQERLSEALEQVNTLENKIRDENDRAPRKIEPEENVDSETIDNSSYSESEGTPKRSTYYYPAGITRSGHFAKKSHYQSRRSHHRSHKGGYFYKKHKNGKPHRSKSYYKKRHHKKQHLRGYRHKKPYYRKQHRRNHSFGSNHNRSRRLGVYHNRLNLKLN